MMTTWPNILSSSLSNASTQISCGGNGHDLVGEEIDAAGEPTGYDENPQLNMSSVFFQSCVRWKPTYPSLPNSPTLDRIRGFNGCDRHSADSLSSSPTMRPTAAPSGPYVVFSAAQVSYITCIFLIL